MSLHTWLAQHTAVPYTRLATGAYQVFSSDPALWRLSDYLVSSAVSGPSVIMVPR